MAGSGQDRSILDDFEAEQTDLRDLLLTLAEDEWLTPTPAEGWDVRDTVSHLADTEEIAHDTATGGPRQLNTEAAAFDSGDAFTLSGVEKGRDLAGPDVLDWWWQAAAKNRAALGGLDTSARVPWGLGMGWRAFVTARLMEHWAHGLDIHSATGRPAVDTDRLRHVAWIGINALPYAYGVVGVTPPAGRTLRFDLVGPNGDTWSIGPADATDTVSGPAGEWCRLAVQRIARDEAPNLRAEGPLADLALSSARAFL
ncbi:MAG: hypothetical protein QOG03_2645 [Actinomycetota bacterium]|nr:hypothetical protein [Actinomycetota bacterium]